MFNEKIMKNKFMKSITDYFCFTLKQKKSAVFLLLFAISCFSFVSAQVTVRGMVVDADNEEVIGATVVVRDHKTIGTLTDVNGRFTLSVPSRDETLVVSYVGMVTQEVPIEGRSDITITLVDQNLQLDEVVIVGYGQQKKTSVVGAITQTTGEVLQRAAGVTDLGAALTGNLPGVITTSSSGLPGEEEPKIIIRSASSWNNTAPLVLVDGVERPMGSVDINSVQSISVLKDASATAVYGVKGANGVILVTTKRGGEGSTKIDVSANYTIKAPSMLPNKLDSYDALMARNVAIEHELATYPSSWGDIRPQSFIEMYRNQTTLEQRERYPNVDWQRAIFKDFTTSYSANLSVSGGTSFVKYFTSADFVHEGDLFKVWDNGRNYQSGYGYNRVNVRSNLDFNLTRSTLFKVNLAGSNGVKKSPWNQTNSSE